MVSIRTPVTSLPRKASPAQPDASWAQSPLLSSSCSRAPTEAAAMQRMHKQMLAEQWQHLESPLKSSLRPSRALPSHARLLLIGKAAAKRTTEALSGGDQWCAVCLRSQILTAWRERARCEGRRHFFQEEEGGYYPVSIVSTASAATVIKAVKAVKAVRAAKAGITKRIVKGLRMEEDSRACPPLGWSAQQSPRDTEMGAAAPTAPKADATAFPFSCFGSRDEGLTLEHDLADSPATSSSVLSEEFSSCPSPPFVPAPAAARAGVAAAATAVENETRRTEDRLEVDSLSLTERNRNAVDSSAVSTSVTSSPRCCNRFSSEERLASSQIAVEARPMVAQEAPQAHEEKPQGGANAAFIDRRTALRKHHLFSHFPAVTTPAFLLQALKEGEGGAGYDLVISRLVALGISLKRGSVPVGHRALC